MSNIPAKALEIKAYAKVNLCLSVKYPPVDGYHQLDSVFQELDLHDTLSFWIETLWTQKHVAYTQSGSAVSLDCNVDGLEVEDNLIFRAIDAAEQACGVLAAAPGSVLCIHVEKHIPAGGGLGGGSSDAAAALKAYARYAGIDQLDARLMDVARMLGADVAFFLYGKAALMDNRGDHLVRRLPSLALPLVLMGDEHGMSTARVYREFDENPPSPPDAHALAAAMESSTVGVSELAGLCSNNLGPIACALSDGLANRLRVAREHPLALNAIVTGSGSTSFAICSDEESARVFAEEIAAHCAWVRVCHGTV